MRSGTHERLGASTWFLHGNVCRHIRRRGGGLTRASVVCKLTCGVASVTNARESEIGNRIQRVWQTANSSKDDGVLKHCGDCDATNRIVGDVLILILPVL
jgi:hypothetical protein